MQTPKSDLYYDVPIAPEEKFKRVPKSYLLERLHYAIRTLREKVEVTTSKHFTDKKSYIFGAIDALSKRLEAIITAGPETIEDSETLNSLCEKIKKAMQAFKGEEKGVMATPKFIAEIFLQEERKAIQELFELKPEKEKTSESAKQAEQLDELRGALEKMESLVRLARQLNGEINQLTIPEEALGIMSDGKTLKLAGKFPDKPSLEEIPGAVKQACLNEFKNYTATLQFVLNLKRKTDQLEGFLAYVSAIENGEDLTVAREHFEKAFSYYKLSLPAGDLQRLAELTANLPEAHGHIEQTKRALEAVDKQINSVLEILTNSRNEIRGIISLSCKEEQAQEIMEALFGKEEEEPGQEPAAAQTEKEQESESETKQKEENGGEKRRFSWLEASGEECKKEAITRIRESEGFSLMGYLCENQKWGDIKSLLPLLVQNDAQFWEMTAVVGGGKLYESIAVLLHDCFPEMEKAEESFVGREKNPKEKIMWKTMSKTERANSIRTRLFGGWPLFKELYEAKMWNELGQLLSKIRLTELNHRFGLSYGACVGNKEKAVYKDEEELFRDVFPEAYQENSQTQAQG